MAACSYIPFIIIYVNSVYHRKFVKIGTFHSELSTLTQSVAWLRGYSLMQPIKYPSPLL